jgi:hypothetical protein
MIESGAAVAARKRGKDLDIHQRQRAVSLLGTLGEHPKPAIHDHLKTGQR